MARSLGCGRMAHSDDPIQFKRDAESGYRKGREASAVKVYREDETHAQ